MSNKVPGTLIHSGFVGKKNDNEQQQTTATSGNGGNSRNRSQSAFAGAGGGWKKRRIVLTDQYVAWFKTQVRVYCIVWLFSLYFLVLVLCVVVAYTQMIHDT